MHESPLYLNGRAEYHFWGNVNYTSNAVAKSERDAKAKALRALGYRVKRSMLANQLHPYHGLGRPDGTIGHVYIVAALGLVN